MSGLVLHNHFSLASCAEVNQICHGPLSSIGITYFNYIKIYVDGSRELLTNNSAWIDHFYKNALYKTVGVIDIEYLLPKGYFLWSELKHDDPAYAQGRETFNIDNGISFVVKKKEATYLYIFASTRDNYLINNFYVRNIDLFKRFILYFNDKAHHLLKKAAKNRIFLLGQQVIENRKVMPMSIDDTVREKFYQETAIDKYFLMNYEEDVYLTRREAECAVYLLEGATAKQIAQYVGISYRTVETYINQMKEKLSCSSKKDLIDALLAANIGDIVFPKKN